MKINRKITYLLIGVLVFYVTSVAIHNYYISREDHNLNLQSNVKAWEAVYLPVSDTDEGEIFKDRIDSYIRNFCGRGIKYSITTKTLRKPDNSKYQNYYRTCENGHDRLILFEVYCPQSPNNEIHELFSSGLSSFAKMEEQNIPWK